MTAALTFADWLRNYEAAVQADDIARRTLCVIAEQYLAGRADRDDLRRAVDAQCSATRAAHDAARRQIAREEG